MWHSRGLLLPSEVNHMLRKELSGRAAFGWYYQRLNHGLADVRHIRCLSAPAGRYHREIPIGTRFPTYRAPTTFAFDKVGGVDYYCGCRIRFMCASVRDRPVPIHACTPVCRCRKRSCWEALGPWPCSICLSSRDSVVLQSPRLPLAEYTSHVIDLTSGHYHG